MKKISEEPEQKITSKRRKSGLSIPKNHQCYGCVWYSRNVDVLYCPFPSCVRYKKGFIMRRERPDDS